MKQQQQSQTFEQIKSLVMKNCAVSRQQHCQYWLGQLEVHMSSFKRSKDLLLHAIHLIQLEVPKKKKRSWIEYWAGYFDISEDRFKKIRKRAFDKIEAERRQTPRQLSPSPSPEPVQEDPAPDLSSQSALPSQQGSASTSAKPSPSPSAKDESSEPSFPMEDSPEPPVEEQLETAQKEIARLRGVLREYMDENEKLEAELKKKMAQGDGESTKEKDLQIEKLEKRLKKLDVEWGRAIHERDWIKKEFENYKKEVAPRMMGLNDVRGEVYQDLREKHNALVQKHNELIDEFNEEHERGSAYKRRLKNAGESVSSSEDEASEASEEAS